MTTLPHLMPETHHAFRDAQRSWRAGYVAVAGLQLVTWPLWRGGDDRWLLDPWGSTLWLTPTLLATLTAAVGWYGRGSLRPVVVIASALAGSALFAGRWPARHAEAVAVPLGLLLVALSLSGVRTLLNDRSRLGLRVVQIIVGGMLALLGAGTIEFMLVQASGGIPAEWAATMSVLLEPFAPMSNALPTVGGEPVAWFGCAIAGVAISLGGLATLISEGKRAAYHRFGAGCLLFGALLAVTTLACQRLSSGRPISSALPYAATLFVTLLRATTELLAWWYRNEFAGEHDPADAPSVLKADLV